MAFSFVSGNPALDLAGTRKWRNDAQPEELLRGAADLQRWLVEVADLAPDLPVDHTALEAALALREAVYRLASDRLQGVPFHPSNLAVVNALAALPGVRVRLSPDRVERDGSAQNALADVARSAISVLSDPDACLKECGRASCTRIYLDRSRGARRTWCGMDECGNRMKAAAYRARKRVAADTQAHVTT
ncbi:ABATE domain-containing protein [Modestobacter sp. VKM Ac-2979]|uniref:CGNR zinc finger domain-containing protein n=1 Tax=unclassified Modestobacter TaxID=2643866 RepID=UPI0022AB6AFF|nr:MULTISPECIES: ABATE domain-containing protein [unclassified Modestobacter]MCZ2811955.1 ABATE domain-containing protein [Modestobacter sp. VKM Ac-2979]MCZ2843678.1 ABATE domain-containing protein [Modestobacter sp. VKM Ac-2980]